MMTGQIQSQYISRKEPYEYQAFELPFGVFRGHRGTPLLLENARERVIGVVSNRKILTFKNHTDENSDEEVEVHSSFSIAVSLTLLGDWLNSL